MNPHPPNPKQPAAGVGQISGPGPWLGAIGPHGGHLEQAQGPAAGTVGQQLGGHHRAQLICTCLTQGFPRPLVIVLLPASRHPDGSYNSKNKPPTKSSFGYYKSCYLGITRRCSLFSRCLISRGAGSQGGKAQANQQGKAGGNGRE